MAELQNAKPRFVIEVRKSDEPFRGDSSPDWPEVPCGYAWARTRHCSEVAMSSRPEGGSETLDGTSERITRLLQCHASVASGAFNSCRLARRLFHSLWPDLPFQDPVMPELRNLPEIVPNKGIQQQHAAAGIAKIGFYFVREPRAQYDETY
jgi:hypothetical protein